MEMNLIATYKVIMKSGYVAIHNCYFVSESDDPKIILEHILSNIRNLYKVRNHHIEITSITEISKH